MTSDDIHSALRVLFNVGGHETVYFKEFRAGTGYAPGSERYLDAWVMDTFPSSGMTKTAIEIKVSRSDFLREKKSPMKRDSALRISNHFYFCAPAGLLTVRDLPDECGLIEVVESFDGDLTKPIFTARFAVDAPFRECPGASWLFVASLARRAMK